MKFKKLVSTVEFKLRNLSFPDYSIFSIYAVIIGVAAGLSAVLFHNSIDYFNKLFFEKSASGLFFLGAGFVIIIPLMGMLIQAIMIKAFPEIAKRKGVSEVIKAVAVRGGYIPLRTTVFHFIAPVICIGSGGTVGPEGPAAQIGGGVASKISTLAGLSDSRVRIFTAAGAGAAISAIFNTPLGGVFFALEIILLNDFQSPTFSALILASVTASAISRIFIGNESVFIFSSAKINDYSTLYLFAILGLFSGVFSILFIKYSNLVSIFFKNLFNRKKLPQWVAMSSVGLLVGISGYFYQEILGIGYNAINEILNDKIIWNAVAILLVLKFLLVPLILHSGGFGGVFAPSLFMGASFGYLFAIALHYFFGVHVNITTFVLVSMGAMLGGINTIPISAILIIFEMTKDYSFILPLMLAVIISTTLVQITLKGSIHLKHLTEQGFQVNKGRDSNILKSLSVSDVDLDKIELISEDTPLPKLISKLIDSPNHSFYTINPENKITGIISESEIRPIITEYDHLKTVLVANDVAKKEIISVQPEDNLDYVLNLFAKYDLDQLPVLDPKENNKVLGGINRQKVLEIYNKESLKINLVDGISNELKTLTKTEPTKLGENVSLMEISIPSEFIGKTLKDLDLRKRHNIEVLMIKKQQGFFESENERSKTPLEIPNADYKFEESDSIIIFGENESIERFLLTLK